MLSLLPDLTPRDAHSLWYASPRHPKPQYQQPTATNPDPNDTFNQPTPAQQARARHALIERTPLARLRAEEHYSERRRLNVANFGSTWLKPPGLTKSLHQMREERREAEEHAEAMRREEAAHALAEAEAAAAGGGGDDMEADLDGDQVMAEGGSGVVHAQRVNPGERNLDDDIPEAEGFSLNEDDDDDDGDDGDPDAENNLTQMTDENATGRTNTQTRMRNLRATEDRVRNLVVQGSQTVGETEIYGADEEDDMQEQDRTQLLEEQDIIHMSAAAFGSQPMDDLNMDVDLDADIEEGGLSGYAESASDPTTSSPAVDRSRVSLRSPPSGRYGRNMPRSSLRSTTNRHQQEQHRSSLAPSDMDISGLVSGEESSFVHSSPALRRRPR